MAFKNLSERLNLVAEKALDNCKKRFGSKGLKIETGIDDAIMWRPTFYMKPSTVRYVAVEVEDNLYPGSLKGAAHEIGHFDAPIAVYQACTLQAFLQDPKQKNVNLLKDHGFGIITVDEDGTVVVQHSCIPLAQHIAPALLEREIVSLSPPLKVAFRSAYDTYKTSEGQGLQNAGQIVEALVTAIATQAHKRNLITSGQLGSALANRIDALWAVQAFHGHRAALGEARSFVNEFRNVASHPAGNAKQAADRIRKCRAGFLQAIALCVKLKAVAKALGYTIKVHV